LFSAQAVHYSIPDAAMTNSFAVGFTVPQVICMKTFGLLHVTSVVEDR
jgi:hypothetical protein